jgi:hypothetical protein
MSLFVEIGGMIAGMLSEYASSRRWSKLKTFFVTSGSSFALFATYVLVFPSDRGILIDILFAVCVGIINGALFVGIMHYYQKRKT